MSLDYTLRLGPLAFRTASDGGPSEALGNAIEVVGSTPTSADPTPKPFQLSVPVGWLGKATREDGLRARRQVRALLNNGAVRMRGLYFQWDIDPELNGWLLVGGGDLEAGDAGGISMGEWKLTLKDCYVVGRRRTHRPALQADVVDRRLSTTPRDVLRRIYATDFAAMATVSRLALPAGAEDLVTYGTLPTLQTLTTQDGDIARAEGLVNGQVLSFEQADGNLGKADVQVWDQQGSSAEADWEAVYGPDQPLTAGAVPVIENGLCRVRLSVGSLALEAFSGGAWVERGRVPLGTLASALVVEWSSERAVIGVVSTVSGVRTLTYVTIQCGWRGPMIERYATGTVALRFVLATTGTVFYRQPTSGTDVVASGNPLGSASVSTFSGENWLELTRAGVDDLLAVLRSATATARGSESAVYGSARSYVELTGASYVAARFALAVTLPLAVNGGPFIFDDFSSNSIANYTVTGTGIAISGGLITVSSTTAKTLLYTASGGLDGAVVLKINAGTSVTTWSQRMILRGTNDANYLAAELSNTGSLRFLKRVGGSDTTLGTPLAGANITASTSYWMVLRASVDKLTAEWWTTNPALGGAPSRITTHTLSAGDLTLFPAGAGKAGALMTPGGTNWTYDDLLILPASSEPQKLGQETLTDARAVPVLVART